MNEVKPRPGTFTTAHFQHPISHRADDSRVVGITRTHQGQLQGIVVFLPSDIDIATIRIVVGVQIAIQEIGAGRQIDEPAPAAGAGFHGQRTQGAGVALCLAHSIAGIEVRKIVEGIDRDIDLLFIRADIA